MYTATLVSKTIQREKQRILVVVDIIGETTERKEFSFSLNTTLDQIKKTINQYITELEQAQSLATNLNEGNLDLTVTPPVDTPPTQAELDRTAWEADFAKLKKVQELIDCGALTGSETAIVTLRNKVKADFKPAYLA